MSLLRLFSRPKQFALALRLGGHANVLLTLRVGVLVCLLVSGQLCGLALAQIRHESSALPVPQIRLPFAVKSTLIAADIRLADRQMRVEQINIDMPLQAVTHALETAALKSQQRAVMVHQAAGIHHISWWQDDLLAALHLSIGERDLAGLLVVSRINRSSLLDFSLLMPPGLRVQRKFESAQGPNIYGLAHGMYDRPANETAKYLISHFERIGFSTRDLQSKDSGARADVRAEVRADSVVQSLAARALLFARAHCQLVVTIFPKGAVSELLVQVLQDTTAAQNLSVRSEP